MGRVRTRSLALAGGLLSLSALPLAANTPLTFSKSPKAAPVIIAPPPAEVIAEAIRAEMDAYARRLDACTRLRQIAIETGNDALLNDADDIERQAALLYQARVARLGINAKSPLNEAKSERRLSGTIDPTRVAPPAPVKGGAR